MYQEWDCLIDLLEQDKATELEKLASDSGWREVKPSEAEKHGIQRIG